MSTTYYKCKKCEHTWNIFYIGLTKPELPICNICKTKVEHDLIKGPPPDGSWNLTIGMNI